MEINQQYLNVTEAATYAGLAPITIRRAVKNGRLKAWNVGGSQQRPTYRIAVDDLEDFVQAVPASSPTTPRREPRKRKGKEEWQEYFGPKKA